MGQGEMDINYEGTSFSAYAEAVQLYFVGHILCR